MIVSVNYTASRTQREQLPLIVSLLGKDHHQEHVRRPSGLRLYQCFVCTKGEGVFVVDGQEHHIRADEGFLLYPDVDHEYYAVSEDWKLDFLAFEGSLAADLLGVLGMPDSCAYHFFTHDYIIASIERMIQTYEQNDEYAYELSAACYDLLIHLPQMIEPLASLEAQTGSIMMTTVISYIEQNYQNFINLDDVARHCNYSKEYLCAVFKREMNQTLNTFLTGVRISKARVDLLQNPQKRVQDVAYDCGFNSASYFCKVFKRYEGMTPDQYRKLRGVHAFA